jgi:hypothetical protein
VGGSLRRVKEAVLFEPCLRHGELRRFYNDKRIKFYIGDVRNESSVRSAMMGVDYFLFKIKIIDFIRL